jgi:hypothetical protein
MKRVISILTGLALGVVALAGVATAQDKDVSGNADGSYVVGAPGAPANGDGGLVVYGDIQTGTIIGPPVTLPPAPVDGAGDTSPPPPADGSSDAPPLPADGGSDGSLPPAPPVDNGPTAAPSPTDGDGDNLSDEAEAVQGTDPFNPDTDGDHLADGDELNLYHTGPLVFDTDGDGRGDGAEVFGDHTDPLVADAPAAGAPTTSPQAAETTASEGDATVHGNGAASAAPGSVTTTDGVVLSGGGATCGSYTDWYSAQTSYEAAGGVNADPAMVTNLDPDGDGIACESMMET